MYIDGYVFTPLTLDMFLFIIKINDLYYVPFLSEFHLLFSNLLKYQSLLSLNTSAQYKQFETFSCIYHNGARCTKHRYIVPYDHNSRNYISHKIFS